MLVNCNCLTDDICQTSIHTHTHIHTYALCVCQRVFMLFPFSSYILNKRAMTLLKKCLCNCGIKIKSFKHIPRKGISGCFGNFFSQYPFRYWPIWGLFSGTKSADEKHVLPLQHIEENPTSSGFYRRFADCLYQFGFPPTVNENSFSPHILTRTCGHVDLGHFK